MSALQSQAVYYTHTQNTMFSLQRYTYEKKKLSEFAIWTFYHNWSTPALFSWWITWGLIDSHGDCSNQLIYQPLARKKLPASQCVPFRFCGPSHIRARPDLHYFTSERFHYISKTDLHHLHWWTHGFTSLKPNIWSFWGPRGTYIQLLEGFRV